MKSKRLNVASSRLFSSFCALLIGSPLAIAQVGNAPDAQGPATAPAFVGRGGPQAPPADVSAENIQTLYGFKVEVVIKADREKNGSWISMAKDSKGRFLLGGQRGQPLTRVTVDDGKLIKEEVLDLPVTETMGILEVGDALYLNGGARGPNGQPIFGLHRLRDPKGDGSYNEVELLREWPRGSGEHGSHGLVLGPDKKHIYLIHGNAVPQAPDVSPISPVRNYADDRVIPRQEDTFMANEKPPGGSIIRMDLDGKNPEVIASGQRNTYDLAFNADGEIFGFDSDMEWDWGTPWYRPTRVFHAVIGADFGYRGGSGKLPTYYEDTMPPVINIGIGSPTGVLFGYGAKFPAKYQKAFYVLDWTYGRMFAVHLKPVGATYEAAFENFVAPRTLHSLRKNPLNLTDAVIGDDGAMYFTIGGRNTQACLYRVTYVGDESTAPVDAHDREGVEARDLRHRLEALNGLPDPTAVATAWPYLSNDDRTIRYTARLAVEAQPVAEWQTKAMGEANPQAAIEAMIALARVGGKDTYADVLSGLAKFPMSSLSEDLQLQKLRCLEIVISRNGRPSIDLAEAIISELDPLYPSHSTALNNELSQILLSLNAPGALAKTIKLFQGASTIDEQVAYLMYLRKIKIGWEPQLRRDYFSWFNTDHAGAHHPDQLVRWFSEAGRAYNNGNSFNGFVARIWTEATGMLTPEEKASEDLAPILSAYRPPVPPNRGGGRNGARGGRGGFRGGRGAPATAPGITMNSPAAGSDLAFGASAPVVVYTDAAITPAATPAPRSVVKEWKVVDLESSLSEVGNGRSFRRGQGAYAIAQCAACHAMAGTPAAGGVGPDLTAIAARFRRRDILESIIEPSKVISEQFADTSVRLKNGDVVVGRVLEDTEERMIFQTNPRFADKTEVKKSEIVSRRLSPLSPMPTGLIDTLNKDEILDLLAYLEAGGRSDHPDFAK